MSKERELLARVLTSELWSVQEELQAEIKELLAQPEHIEDKIAMVEPVAWIIETQKIDGAFDKWVSMDKKHHKDFCDRGEPIPLYTSPPTRKPLSEPLSDGELPTYNPKINTDGERLAFHAGIRWAEHQHGIGINNV